MRSPEIPELAAIVVLVTLLTGAFEPGWMTHWFASHPPMLVIFK